MSLAVTLYYAVLGGLSAVTLVLTVRARNARGPVADGGRVHDLLDAAFLADGPGRVADTLIAEMHAAGRLELAGPGIVRIPPGTVPANPAEEALLTVHAAAPSGALRWLRYGVMRSPAVQETGDRLAARGLLWRPGARPRTIARLTAAALSALGVLSFFGAVALTMVQYGSFLSEDPGTPVVLLVLPVIAVSVITGIACAALLGTCRTRAGREALARVRGEYPGTVAVDGVRAVRDPLLRAHLNTAARGSASGRSRSGSSTALPFATAAGAGAVGAGAAAWCGASSSCGSASSSCGSSSSSCGGGSSSSCGGGGSSCGSSG